MRAGLLREWVTFKEPVKVIDRSGGQTVTYKDVYRARAYRKRFSNVTDKDKLDAKEVFYGHFGILQVRYSPLIKEDQIVEYQGNLYKIILLDRHLQDNTYLLNLTKLNV